mmetsp:Transcript_114836/g.245158  ORF Transcript_114836/g.245158 Transcript_114836/m.245158 type:complete len:377 (-) Transcript_114836:145-1275(-)
MPAAPMRDVDMKRLRHHVQLRVLVKPYPRHCSPAQGAPARPSWCIWRAHDLQPHEATAAEAVPTGQRHRPLEDAQATRTLKHVLQREPVFAQLSLATAAEEVPPFRASLQARNMHPRSHCFLGYAVAEADHKLIIPSRDGAACAGQVVFDLPLTEAAGLGHGDEVPDAFNTEFACIIPRKVGRHWASPISEVGGELRHLKSGTLRQDAASLRRGRSFRHTAVGIPQHKPRHRLLPAGLRHQRCGPSDWNAPRRRTARWREVQGLQFKPCASALVAKWPLRHFELRGSREVACGGVEDEVVHRHCMEGGGTVIADGSPRHLKPRGARAVAGVGAIGGLIACPLSLNCRLIGDPHAPGPLAGRPRSHDGSHGQRATSA